MADDPLKKDAETLDQALLQLTILGQTATTCAPVNLDAETSVNLSKVARYESRELLQTEQGGVKIEEPYPSFDPPQFAPFLVFDDGSEMELATVAADNAPAGSKTQNEIFRQAWGQYARLLTLTREYLNRLFPAAPPAAAVPAAEQSTEVVQ